jgi:hypothetical protein
MIEELNPYRDPYAGFAAQTEPEQTYSGGNPGKVFVSLLSLPGVATGFYFLLNGYQYLCTLTIGVVIIAVFGYVLFQQIRSTTCGKEGIRFCYWLRPSVFLRWDNICTLRVKTSRGGFSGRLTTCAHALRVFPVIFPIKNYLAVRDAPIIVRTIAERASLTFIKGTISGEAEYQRVQHGPDPPTLAKALLSHRKNTG